MSNNAENITSKMLMPEFTIDTVYGQDGKVKTMGIKRMFDIALALKDSIMQWGAPGCIAGDMIIRGYWDGKDKTNNRKGVKIKDIFAHQHGKSYHGSYQIKSKNFIVKSYNEEKGCIEETTVTSTYSGKKQCYLIKTANQEVEVTEEHPFLTQRGWVECKDLSLNDTVFVYPNKQSEGLKRTTGKTTIHNDEQVCVKYHPTGSKKVINGYTYYRKAKYILEYEAIINKLSYKEYIKQLNKGITRLYFVPKDMEIHHIDRDRTNNNPNNVLVLSKADHAKLHAVEDTFTNVVKPVQEKIVSITKTKVKDTYDLTCEKNHNFFAGNILVHNCGKSQGVLQWNAKKVKEYQARIEAGEQVKPWNPVVCDVRLSMKEPVDMVGVPIPTKNDKGETVTVWAIPSMWPKDDSQFSGGTIHLDEMNQGQAAILNAAFQLVQDRALGDYKVPEGYIIIGSSNPSAYNGTVTEFSIPLSNRFSHFNIKTDFDGWLNYRLNHGGNVDVMSFLKTQDQSILFDRQGMEAKVGDLSDTLYTDIVVTPRSWEVVEKLLNLPEGTEENGGFTLEEKKYYATGRLGNGIANRLFTYIKDKAKFQSWQEILVDGKDFRDESSEQFWSVQLACLSTINLESDDTKCRQYVLNFIKATRNLKSIAYKTINITSLVHSDRLKKATRVFNPLIDAQDLLILMHKSYKAN